MKYVTVMLLSIMLYYNVNGQAKSFNLIPFSPSEKELESGDKVPDLIVKPMDKSPISLSSLRGKLVILDFFGVHCSSCIKALPEMQRLQDQFAEKIKIIIVSKDDSTAIRNLLNRFEKLKRIHLPFVSNDTTFSKYFYTPALPVHVWIDTNGIVIQKTAGYNTSEQKIANWLKGEKIQIPRYEALPDFEKEVPLFAEGRGRQIPLFKYYSILMGIPYGSSGQGDHVMDHDSVSGKIVHILRTRETIPDLYRYAYYKEKHDNDFVYDPSRLLLNVSDVSRFEFRGEKDQYNEWRNNNYYSYEIKVPPQKADSIFKWMQEDLQRYFGYTARIEKRNTKCWVLRSSGPFKANASRSTGSEFTEGSNFLHVRNWRFVFFVERLARSKALRGLPLISEVPGLSYISLDLNCNLSDASKLEKELSKFNLSLNLETRPLNMFVISD
jgi:thiol-disulfide isomerase/thioredoxin